MTHPNELRMDPHLTELLWNRLAHRIAAETGGAPARITAWSWAEPAWEEVAPGVSVNVLATDTEL